MGTAPNGYNTPKTNWAAGNIPAASDFNRIEMNIQAVEEGQRTIDQAQTPASNAGSLRQFLDWFANRIKAITGKTNWYDAPSKTLEDLNTHINAAAPHSGHAPLNHDHTKDEITDFMHTHRMLYFGDETEMYVYGSTATSIKTLTMTKCLTAGLYPTSIYIIATLKVTGGTGSLEIYVDGVLKQTLSTASTSYALVYSPSAISISSWGNNSIHTIDIKLKNSGSYTTYNQLLEIYIE